MKTLKRFGLYSYAKYKFNSKEFAYTFAKLIQIKSAGLLCFGLSDRCRLISVSKEQGAVFF